MKEKFDKILSLLGNLSGWEAIHIGEINLLKNVDESTPLTEEEMEQIHAKIDRRNQVIVADPETGKAIIKDGKELSEQEWGLIDEKYEEKDHTENAVWLTTPDQATDFINYNKFLGENVDESRVSEDKVVQALKEAGDEKTPDYFSILNMARYIKGLHERGEHQRAMKYKNDVGRQYESVGLHIVNLYGAGYFERVVREFDENMGESSEAESKVALDALENLLEKPIFFIGSSEPDDISNIITKVNKTIQSSDDPITLHGIGDDYIPAVAEIFAKTGHHANNNNYGIEVKHDMVTGNLSLNVLYTPNE